MINRVNRNAPHFPLSLTSFLLASACAIRYREYQRFDFAERNTSALEIDVVVVPTSQPAAMRWREERSRFRDLAGAFDAPLSTRGTTGKTHTPAVLNDRALPKMIDTLPAIGVH